MHMFSVVGEGLGIAALRGFLAMTIREHAAGCRCEIKTVLRVKWLSLSS